MELALATSHEGDEEQDRTGGGEGEEKEEEEEERLELAEWEEGAVHGILPVEVMLHVLSMVDPVGLVCAERVCRSWHHLCRSDWVWEAVHRTHFSRHATVPKGKFIYCNIYFD